MRWAVCWIHRVCSGWPSECVADPPLGVPFERLQRPAGDAFESSVQHFVSVFVVVVVAVVAELDGGGSVVAKFGQFLAVHPHVTLGPSGVSAISKTLFIFCVLRWFGMP